ncbi:MAG: hypothetical protein A2Z01_08510 [Betaproteobacteria bacterium RBG_16_58_11]|nr:MAG: hypothetical protein A2Z01_08510 [Betaproteobacteria bacterium RBG_16_58_11]
MFSPSREDARRGFFETWRKYQAREPVDGIEAMLLEVILQHPEYHALLSKPDQYQDRDYSPEHGETNPFLHMSMHLAINEQLSIDQPPGIRERHQALLERLGDAHGAQHTMLECLAEEVWHVQRHQVSFDAERYLGCIDRQSHE